MTEPRHGTGASGWCLGRKRCAECAYAACGCSCHDGTERPEPQGDSRDTTGTDRLGETGQMCENGLGNDERPAASTADRSSHSDSLYTIGGRT